MAAGPSFAVMGAGAIGGYFGGRLAAAGYDVAFIARGAQLAALQADGLQILSPLGDATIAPVRASDDSAEIGPVDFILFMVKLWDTEAAAALLAPLLGPDTAVVPFQNGIDSEARIAAVIGPGRVMPGAAFIPAAIERPGVIRHAGGFARLVFGEPDGSRSSRGEVLLKAVETAGIEAALSPGIGDVLWQKFVMIASHAGVSTLARRPSGEILGDADLRATVAAAMAEVVAVGEAEGAGFPDDFLAAQMDLLDKFPAQVKPSMLQDFDAGRRLEIEGLSGTVVRLAAAHGIAVPVHRTIFAALKPYKDGPPENPS
jgi:2-dehydropantoate 2-reductase